MPQLALLPPHVAQTLLIAWMAALGGVIGSFLNVVVYRLPAGMSLSWPGSQCPACKHPIRWYDNVPVLAWFWLGGRCRDCGAKISPRYPIVEGITAAVFVLVGAVEGLSGGANLPIRPEPVSGGVLMLPLTNLQLAGIVAYHLLAVSTLIAAAGIEYDGHRVPLRLAVPALVAGLLTPAVWPHLHPVPAWPGLFGPEGALPAGLVDGAAGLAAGALLGLAAWPLTGRPRGFGFLLASACVGLYLGWQSAVVIVPAAAAVHVALGLLGRLWRGRAIALPTMWLAAVTLAWILAWKPIVACWPL